MEELQFLLMQEIGMPLDPISRSFHADGVWRDEDFCRELRSMDDQELIKELSKRARELVRKKNLTVRTDDFWLAVTKTAAQIRSGNPSNG
ncbi:hypothetical protein [Roseibium alexandrii]|uniref:hypothetical protein n=1 Tax=Roseibium alexandrii TaxID=388408 RepID=UPI00375339FF